MEMEALATLTDGLLKNPSAQGLIFSVVIFLGVRELISMFSNIKRKLNGNDDREKWKNIVGSISERIGENAKRYDKTMQQIDWLYDSHHKFDEQGVPIWYTRKSLEKAIEKLAIAIEKQSAVLTRMLDVMNDTRRDIQILDEHVKGNH